MRPVIPTAAEVRRRQRLESIGPLAGGIAHDVNNMLFAIRGHAELLTQDLASMARAGLEPDRMLESVNAINQAAEGATALTAQLLALGRQQMVTTTCPTCRTSSSPNP
jgi:signal transduction histidine kinase